MTRRKIARNFFVFTLLASISLSITSLTASATTTSQVDNIEDQSMSISYSIGLVTNYDINGRAAPVSAWVKVDKLDPSVTVKSVYINENAGGTYYLSGNSTRYETLGVDLSQTYNYPSSGTTYTLSFPSTYSNKYFAVGTDGLTNIHMNITIVLARGTRTWTATLKGPSYICVGSGYSWSA